MQVQRNNSGCIVVNDHKDLQQRRASGIGELQIQQKFMFLVLFPRKKQDNLPFRKRRKMFGKGIGLILFFQSSQFFRQFGTKLQRLLPCCEDCTVFDRVRTEIGSLLTVFPDKMSAKLFGIFFLAK